MNAPIDDPVADALEAAGFRRFGGLTTDDYARLGFTEFMRRYCEETGIKPGGDAPDGAYDHPEIVWTWLPQEER